MKSKTNTQKKAIKKQSNSINVAALIREALDVHGYEAAEITFLEAKGVSAKNDKSLVYTWNKGKHDLLIETKIKQLGKVEYRSDNDYSIKLSLNDGKSLRCAKGSQEFIKY